MNRTLQNVVLSTLILCALTVSQAATITITQLVAFGDLDALSYDLTNTYGTSDWMVWNSTGLTPGQEKNGGSGLLSLSYSPGAGTPGLSASNSGSAPSLTWTDGSPTPIGASGISVLRSASDNINNGQTFTLTADAGTETSTLYVWLLAQRASGTLSGSFSVSSATDSLAFGQGLNNPNMALYQIDFTADNPGEVFTLNYEKTSFSGTSNAQIGIQAAALTVIPEPSSIALMAVALVSLLALRRRTA